MILFGLLAVVFSAIELLEAWDRRGLDPMFWPGRYPALPPPLPEFNTLDDAGQVV